MITDADIQKMKQVFATKDDLTSMEHRIQKSIKKVDKKLDDTTKHLDKNLNYHHRRLVQLEGLSGVKPPPYVVLPN